MTRKRDPNELQEGGKERMDAELKTALEAIRGDLEQFRSETDANFQAVRSQLNTLEYGVLTIAQKLLAENEVREIQSRMRRRATAVG